MSDADAAAASSVAVPPAPVSSRGGAVPTRAPDGQGTMRWPNGDSWEGASKNGQRQGVGWYRWSDGRIYAGEFEANKHSGLGVQWDKDGKLGECGQWKDDKFVKSCAVPLRCIPEGKWLSDAALQAKRAHPKASSLFPNGSHYIGQLNAEGQPDGQGASFYPDGSPEITLIVDGAADSGRWINGKVNGRATQIYDNGDRYEGLFEDGLREGLGSYSWKSGSRYEGQFVAGESSGLGAEWDENGTLSKCGRWKDDKLVESCAVPLRLLPVGKHLSVAALKAKRDHPNNSALFDDGTHYVGRLNAGGQPNGQGASFYPDGRPEITLRVDEDASLSGLWTNGKLNGRATELFANGDRYEGGFKDGQRHGLGVYNSKAGWRREGEWVAGKCSGLGALWEKDGKLTQCGRWAHDKLVLSCAVLLRLLPEGKYLSDAALQAKRDYPDGSALWPSGSHYIGSLNAQGQPHGQGSSFHPDGSPFVTLRVDPSESKSGRWIDGKLHGRATQIFDDGDRYEGLFKDDLRHGLGSYSWKDGRRYEGGWVAGKQSGLGALWDNGGKLSNSGRWKDGRFVEACAVPLSLLLEGTHLGAAALQAKRDHPDSSALLPDGLFYIGTLNAAGQPDVQGASFHPDGTPEITLIVDGAADSGRWINGKVNGRATENIDNGDRYEGLFKDDLRHGLGSYSWKDGSRYEGEFVADESSGLGVQWNKNGELVACGGWKDDELVESCAVPLQCLSQKRFLSPHAKTASLLLPDGGYFVGPLNARNQRDGEGSMHTSDGSLIVSGRWLNDRPVQPAPLPAALASSAAFASSFAAAVAAAAAATAASPSPSSVPPASAAAAAAAPTAAASSLSSVSHTPVAAAASAAASAAFSAAASSSSASVAAAPAAASSASAPAMSAVAFPALGFPLPSPLPSLSLAGFTGLYEGERNDAGQRHGLGVQWGADGVIARCGRWKEDKYVGKSAVPLKHLQGALLSVSALRAKLDHPDGSLVRLDLRRFYVGQVNYRHVPHGQGSSFYRDGFPEIVLAVDDADPSLSGRWVKGMLHGRATQMLSNGICYSGLFKDSGFEGLGVYVWPTGERFEGEFSAGKFNGFGAQWSSQGTLSKCGRWVDDVCVEECAVALDRIPEGKSLSAAAAQCKSAHPNGSLVRLDETGRFYIGAVNERGQPHGQGQTFYPSGAPQYTPTVDPTARLSGRWVDGLLQGRATRMLVRGDRYDGLFQDDCCEGLGVYVGSAGWRYEGEFTASTRTGLGVQWDSQGKLIKCGRWEDSKLVASCAVPIHVLPDKHWLSAHAKTASLLFPDGGYFVGPINAQNQRHGGSGQMFSASGDLLFSGTWNNDQLQFGSASSVTASTDTLAAPAADAAAAVASIAASSSRSALAPIPLSSVPVAVSVCLLLEAAAAAPFVAPLAAAASVSASAAASASASAASPMSALANVAAAAQRIIAAQTAAAGADDSAMDDAATEGWPVAAASAASSAATAAAAVSDARSTDQLQSGPTSSMRNAASRVTTTSVSASFSAAATAPSSSSSFVASAHLPVGAAAAASATFAAPLAAATSASASATPAASASAFTPSSAVSSASASASVSAAVSTAAACSASSSSACLVSAASVSASAAVAPTRRIAGSKRAAEAEARDDAAERSDEEQRAAAAVNKRTRTAASGVDAAAVVASVPLLEAASAPLATAASAAASASAPPIAVSASVSAAASTATSSAASASASASASTSAASFGAASASVPLVFAALPMSAAVSSLRDTDAAAAAQRTTAAVPGDDATMDDADATEGRAVASAWFSAPAAVAAVDAWIHDPQQSDLASSVSSPIALAVAPVAAVPVSAAAPSPSLVAPVPSPATLSASVTVPSSCLSSSSQVSLPGSNRKALLIGNSQYDAPLSSLDCCRNNTVEMQAALSQVGFHCTTVFDADRKKLFRAWREFVASLEPNDLVFIYCSGIIAQLDGTTYLLPADYGNGALMDDAVSLKDLMERLVSKHRDLVSILVLDCCRANDADAASEFVRPPSTGQCFFASSSAPTTAFDRGRLSCFTACLLDHLLTPGLLIEQVWKRANKQLRDQSSGQQRAWHHNSLTDDIVLNKI